MEGNRVCLIENKYVIKKAKKEVLRAEKIFIDNNRRIKHQQILDYNEEKNYVVYKYINGDIIHHLCDVNNCLLEIYKIVEKYKETDIDGYGNVFDLQEKWTDFLYKEIEKQSKYLNNNNNFKHIVINKLNVLEKYKTKNKLIHGDLGCFNIICKKRKIVGIIDPRCIVGDPIYDFIYFIFSSYNIANEINWKDVFQILNRENKEKILAMIYILLYDRIAKEQKNDTKYKNEFYQILNKVEKYNGVI